MVESIVKKIFVYLAPRPRDGEPLVAGNQARHGFQVCRPVRPGDRPFTVAKSIENA